MTYSERFKFVMDILEEEDLTNNTRNHNFFGKLSDEDLNSTTKVQEVIKEIMEYEASLEKKHRYPENILQCIRQRHGLGQYDTSRDDEWDALDPDHVFSDVCGWNGLLGRYDMAIKSWIKDIYNVELGR